MSEDNAIDANKPQIDKEERQRRREAKKRKIQEAERIKTRDKIQSFRAAALGCGGVGLLCLTVGIVIARSPEAQREFMPDKSFSLWLVGGVGFVVAGIYCWVQADSLEP